MTPESGETAVQTTALVPQSHGGALKPGGTRGNKGGGRRPDWLKAALLRIATSNKALSAVRTIAQDVDDKRCIQANAALWERALPKEAEGAMSATAGVQVVIEVVREGEWRPR